jgi:hypothetical protein
MCRPLDVSRDTGASTFGFGLGPIGKLAGSRLEPRLGADLQLFHDPLTLRCDEIGAATELSGNLLVCFSSGEAPQQLPLLRRQLVVVRR